MVIGVIACVALLILLWQASDQYVAIYTGLISSLLFYYKEGFVSHGGHACFQGVAAIFSILLFLFNSKEISESVTSIKDKKIIISSTAIIVAICCCYSGDFIGNGLSQFRSRVFDAPISLIKAINDDGEAASRLPAGFKEIIGDDTVAAFPWEFSYGFDDDLNFNWMPVIQNYTSYTEWCDQKNADYFYVGKNAPAYLIFTFETIDGRYSLIEAPRTWHAIRNNYDIVTEDSGV